MSNVKRKQIRAENGRMGSLHALHGRYPDERSCERRIMELRWPEGWVCPECGGRTCSPVADRNRVWQCTRCSRQFSVTAGTCMQHSKVHLRRWSRAIWLVARSKRGVSALELAAQIGVSENTARFMLERLRGAMARSERDDVLDGIVEADDFYLAARGRERRPGVGRGTDKVPMIAAVQRTSKKRGKCAVRVASDCTGDGYKAFAAESLAPTAEVRTDGWGGAKSGLRGKAKHRPRKFDRRDPDAGLPAVHHVISNFQAWALGTFHGLSVFYLQAYADEFSWRRSHRGVDATTALLSDCCRGYYSRDELHGGVFPGPLPGKEKEDKKGTEAA